jgi:hypothetical protein
MGIGYIRHAQVLKRGCALILVGPASAGKGPE